MMNGTIAWSWTIKGLDPATRLVLLALAGRADNTTYECFPSHQNISEDTEVSVATIKRALRRLIERGVVQVERRNRKNSQAQSSNCYRLMVSIDYHHPDGKTVREQGGHIDLGFAGDRGAQVNGDPPRTISERTTLEGKPSKESHAREEEIELDLGLPALPPKYPTPGDVAAFVIEQFAARDFVTPIRGNHLIEANAEKARDLGVTFAVPGKTAIDTWTDVFAKIDGSDFLQGKAPPSAGRAPFRLSVSFLLEKRNFEKVLGGRFDGKSSGDDGRGSTSKATGRVIERIRASHQRSAGGRDKALTHG